METSRRSFLGGALALFAATTLPSVAFADAPVIYGDGVHDDWAGLQALLDGKPFRVAGSRPMVLRNDGYATIANGSFRISRGLRITTRVTIAGSYFEAAPGFTGAMLTVESGSEACVVGCHLRGGSGFGVYDKSFLGISFVGAGHSPVV